MQIECRDANGITLVPIQTHLLAQRRILVQGSIDEDAASLFLAQMMVLNAQDTERPIDVFINSPGGEIVSGMLMYDVIQSSRAPVRLFCTGMAYSMGAVLLACGGHGRYILPNSKVI